MALKRKRRGGKELRIEEFSVYVHVSVCVCIYEFACVRKCECVSVKVNHHQ
jgi:hypothetical protein